MAIKFFNIRSGETQVAETEPQITAMWASSDHSPNISQGQDFGWRLAPEVVVEMKRIKQDINLLQTIAVRIQKPLEDITESDILGYISAKSTPETAPVAEMDDYQDVYDQEVRRKLQEAAATKASFDGDDTTLSTATTTSAPQESLEDLQKRVELEERLTAARVANGEADTTTTTENQDTTTTTTENQDTTTTTTVA